MKIVDRGRVSTYFFWRNNNTQRHFILKIQSSGDTFNWINYLHTRLTFAVISWNSFNEPSQIYRVTLAVLEEAGGGCDFITNYFAKNDYICVNLLTVFPVVHNYVNNSAAEFKWITGRRWTSLRDSAGRVIGLLCFHIARHLLYYSTHPCAPFPQRHVHHGERNISNPINKTNGYRELWDTNVEHQELFRSYITEIQARRATIH